MENNFDQALQWVLQSEGGYVNDPRDNGGATNRGITQGTYNRWRRSHNLPNQNVRDIKDIEVEAIYRSRYWDAVAGDQLPGGLDYCVFDFAVNSGPDRAAKSLQGVLLVTPDGQIGSKTIRAIGEHSTVPLIDQYCAEREEFLRKLSDFDAFGRGWIRRVEMVKARAEGLVNV